MGEGRSHWSSMVLRKSQTCFSDRHTHPNSMYLNFCHVLNMSSHLSSYSARHTWATMAYYCEIHPGIISEAMGHSSINVTETYLKPFNDKKIDEANEKVISFVKSNGISA